MAYFIGLDSGGTKTVCALGDESRVLARAVCGTAKLTRVSAELATERLRALLQEVSAAAAVPLRAITRTGVGVAGFSIAAVRDWAARVVGECVGGEVLVLGDDTIALDAAFRGGPGVLVIGGTGSIVLGRTAAGERVSAGGWGPAIGDEGSGFWIGCEAVRRALRALDRREDTMLLDAICSAWSVADAGELTALAHALPAPDFAALAPVVAAMAAAGEPLACALLRQAGEELAEQVGVVWSALRRGGETEARVAWTGSVLEKIPAVRLNLVAALGRHSPALTLLDDAVDSIDGALWHARGANPKANYGDVYLRSE